MGELSRFKCVIFDFDGTVTDSGAQIVAAKAEALDAMGYHDVDHDEIGSYSGMALRDSFILAADIQNERVLTETMELYNRLITLKTLNGLRLFDNIPATLRQLRAKGVRLGLSSLRRDADIDRLMHATGLDRYFDAWIGEDAVENPKPSPDMVLELLERLGVEPEEAVVVGDTIYDIEMGRHAGCHTVAFTGGAQPERILARSNPDTIIGDFSDFAGRFG